MLAKSALQTPDILKEPVYLFSVDEYHRMIDAGVFAQPVELLEGWILPKMGKNPGHVWCVGVVAAFFERVLPKGWHVRRQDPVTTSDSEPEPDVAAVRGSPDDYRTRHPSPSDTGAAVEVAESSINRDRKVKGRVYAHASIPIYWIVNLLKAQVEVYSDPTGPIKKPRYRKKQVYGIDDKVPLVIDGKVVGTIAVRDLIP